MLAVTFRLVMTSFLAVAVYVVAVPPGISAAATALPAAEYKPVEPTSSQLLADASFSAESSAWTPIFQAQNVSLQRLAEPGKGGQHIMRASAAADGGSFGQDVSVAVEPGESYIGQMWVRVPPGGPASRSVTLNLWSLWAPSRQQEVGSTWAAVSHEWTLVTVGIDAQRAHSGLRLELYFDGILDISTASLVPTRLRDTSFSAESSAWTPIFQAQNVSLQRLAEPGKGGQHIMRASAAADGGSFGQDVSVAVRPGESYIGQMWVRVPPGGPASRSVTLNLWSLWAPSRQQEVGSTWAAVSHEWTLVTVGIDAQRAHSGLRLELYFDGILDISTASLTGIPMPTVTAERPQSIATDSADLRGVVNARGVPTSYYFVLRRGEVGQVVGESRRFVDLEGRPVSLTARGLVPGQIYSYRLVAISAGGVTTSNSVEFRTAPSAPTTTPPVPPPAEPQVNLRYFNTRAEPTEHPPAGTAVRIYFSYVNTGNRDSGPFTSRFVLDGTYYIDVQTPSCGGGQLCEAGVQVNYVTAGSHRVEFYLDYEGTVTETNEYDNYGFHGFSATGSASSGAPAMQLTAAP